MQRRTLLPGLIFLLALAVSGTPCSGQGEVGGTPRPPAPPPPAEYDALVRFQIEGFRNQRALGFLDLKRALEEIGFREDPDDPVDPLDPRLTAVPGVVPSARAREMLRHRYVQSIRLQPKGYVPPADKEQLVRVHIDLSSRVPPPRARALRDDVRRVLGLVGFREASAYDERGFTRLVGVLPSGQVEGVAGDLRRHPAGWALLSPTLLTELRASPRGGPLLRSILDDWYDHPEGKKLIRHMLILWRSTLNGAEFMLTLPADLVSSENSVDQITVEVRLLAHLAEHPESGQFLRKLFADVLASKANRELMDRLLNRAGQQLLTLNLPLFFRIIPAIRAVEVLPDLPLPTPRPAPPAIPPGQEKLGPDLRELLVDMAAADRRRRLEVALDSIPAETDREWKRRLQDAVPGLEVEGSIGSLATVVTEPKQALRLTLLPEVVMVRLPRTAHAQMQDDPNKARSNFEPLQKSGVEQLHLMGHQGKGTRVVVIDGDFRGWQTLRGKQLPARTRLLDLTAERSYELFPEPEQGPAQELGHGTRYAVALMRAAPAVELTLVRIDPSCPHQLLTVAQAVAGDVPRSLSLDTRLAELDNDRKQLTVRRDLLLEERRLILEEFGIDEETVKRRKDLFRRQGELDQEEQRFEQRTRRYLQLKQEVSGLKGVRIVASGLVWTEGYPVDGTSALSRYFDDRPFRSALWFQAAGDTQGQAWTGLFRDEDGNGIMEFAPPGALAPQEAWSRELNALAWRAPGEALVRELPEGARLRITLQWRETQDPSFHQTGDDPFRRPLADFRVVLLYQPDPRGQKQPADDLEVVGETVGTPQRLDRTPGSSTYEHVLQFKVPRAGRYLVRIEGKAPESTRPVESPTLPGLRRVGEVRPRLFVDTLQGSGRAVWHHWSTEAGTLGMPADARRVVTVGSATENDERRASSAGGPPHNQEMVTKPDVLAYDAIDQKMGTGLAASFAAGAAAATTHSDTTVNGWFKRLRIQPGEVLRFHDGPR